MDIIIGVYVIRDNALLMSDLVVRAEAAAMVSSVSGSLERTGTAEVVGMGGRPASRCVEEVVVSSGRAGVSSAFADEAGANAADEATGAGRGAFWGAAVCSVAAGLTALEADVVKAAEHHAGGEKAVMWVSWPAVFCSLVPSASSAVLASACVSYRATAVGVVGCEPRRSCAVSTTQLCYCEIGYVFPADFFTLLLYYLKKE